MLDEHVDGEMIEIGDPNEDSTGPDPSPRVVIQYHERGGVPWMLIPPLLVISAVGAVLLYTKVAPPKHPEQQVASLAGDAGPPTPSDDDLVPPEPPARSPSASFGDLSPEAALLPVEPVVSPPETLAPPPIPVEVVAEPDKVAEPPPAPKAQQGIGFDPKVFEAGPKPDAPADPSLAPAAREDRAQEVEKPREVDPEDLPPDPRLAKARQQQRRAEAMQKVDEERFRFHGELKAICNKFREGSGPEIREMAKRYDIRVDPAAEKKAAYLLGEKGPLAGADRGTRIELLRSLGYPEPVILGDLFNNYENKLIHERGGPRSEAEAYYLSALMLLRNPPSRAQLGSRAVSATKGRSNPRPNPSTLGNGAGPSR